MMEERISGKLIFRCQRAGLMTFHRNSLCGRLATVKHSSILSTASLVPSPAGKSCVRSWPIGCLTRLIRERCGKHISQIGDAIEEGMIVKRATLASCCDRGSLRFMVKIVVDERGTLLRRPIADHLSARL